MASISDLANEITKALTEYTSEVEKGIEDKKKENAKKAVQLLVEKSPKGATGKYANGWTESNIDGKEVVYNKNKPQLTHLLEHGHVKRNGGRVDAIPHIRPVEEQISNEFLNDVKKVIQG